MASLQALQTYYDKLAMNNGQRSMFKRVIHVDPLLVNGWVKCGTQAVDQWCQQMGSTDCVVFVALVEVHWIPFMMWMQNNRLLVHAWDQPHESSLTSLLHAFARAFGAVIACTLRPAVVVRWP